MILPAQGDLLDCDAEALVNPVNTVGVMGKGLALQFKQAYPNMFADYKVACAKGEVVPGQMHVWFQVEGGFPHFIVNFPTKRHWRDRSRLEDIEAGLKDLVHVIHIYQISEIAIPPLGCGNGGLDWKVVRPIVVEALEHLSDTVIWLFDPPS